MVGYRVMRCGYRGEPMHGRRRRNNDHTKSHVGFSAFLTLRVVPWRPGSGRGECGVIRIGVVGGDGAARIAVIGGGAAGAAVVGEFLRRGSAACELVWLTGSSAPGRGVAYATNNAMHLLNVRAANMGLFADDAGALLRFLEARCTPALPGDSNSRAEYQSGFLFVIDQLLAETAATTLVSSSSWAARCC